MPLSSGRKFLPGGGNRLFPRELLQLKQAKRRLERLLDPPRLLGSRCSMVLSDFRIGLPHQQQQFPYSCRSWRILRRFEAGDIHIKLWEPHSYSVFVDLSVPCSKITQPSLTGGYCAQSDSATIRLLPKLAPSSQSPSVAGNPAS